MTVSQHPLDLAEGLSRLADGEVSPGELDKMLAELAADGELGQRARQDWRCIQVMGDAMRSPELCGAARSDFAARLTARLALEPAVLSPATSPKTALPPPASRPVAVEAAVERLAHQRSGFGGWRMASGFAGVAAVAVLAGMLGFNLGSDGQGEGASLASRAGTPTGGVALVTSDGSGVGRVSRADGLSAADQAMRRLEASANAQTDPATGLAAVPTSGGVVLRDPSLDAQIADLMTAHRQFGGAAALGVPSGFARAATVEHPVGVGSQSAR